MKAIVFKEYGPPEVAQLMEVEKPIPRKNEVLVKVHASTVNRTDCGFRSAAYFVSRFWTGLIKPKIQILGCEFAGVVEEIGPEVRKFKVGDRVFGFDDHHFGGHGEFLTIRESKAITHIPDKLTFKEAAPLTEGAHYALNNIKAAKVQMDQNVMVYGASGAIGSAAVQILEHYGAQVTAVCGTQNVELVSSLGATRVLDYQTEDFTQTDEPYDFIFDAVGKLSFNECKPILSPKGIYISTELGKRAENIFLALTTPLFGGKKVKFPIPVMDKNKIEYLRHLAEKGKFRPVIDRTYRMEDIVEAYRYVESGQKVGNVILEIRR